MLYLLDANVLLYAAIADYPEHKKTKNWIKSSLKEGSQLKTSWVCLLAYLRIGTNPKVFDEPISSQEAMRFIRFWIENPAFGVLEPGKSHAVLLEKMVLEGQANGALVMDAHLAALAFEHQATLCTADKDFERFPDIKILNPCR